MTPRPENVADKITYHLLEHRDGRREGAEIRFRCVFDGHEDQHPTARWNPRKRTFYCDPCGKGGGWKQLAQFLDNRITAGGNGQGPGRRVVATYSYLDKDGNATLRKLRIEPGKNGRSKDIVWQHKCPKDRSGWGWGYSSKKCGCRRRSPQLYNVEALRKAEPGSTVLIVGGEKCVDAWTSLGALAVCHPIGEGNFNSNRAGRELAKEFKGHRVVVQHDNDATGRDDLEKTAKAVSKVAASVQVLDLSKKIDNFPDKGDVVDALATGVTPEMLLQWTDEAEPYTPSDDHTGNRPPKERSRWARRRAAPKAGPPEDERPEIENRDDDLGVIIDETWEAAETYNKPAPRLFRFGGAACVIGHDESGDPTIRGLTAASMREILARAARWFRVKMQTDPDTGEEEVVRKDTKPPADVASSMLAGDCARLPALLRIIRAPIVAPTGRIVWVEGYDAETRTYYAPRGLMVPAVPDQPTEEDIQAASHLVLDELLGDFPFVGEADRANALAMFLLPFAREIVGDHPTPLHLIEKPSAGSGAGLMVEVLGLVAQGSPPQFMTEGRDEDEWRKRITARLVGGPELVCVDNLRRRLDSAALSSALTARVWTDRELGKSRNITVPVRCVWAATGNNPAVSSEIARRAVSIRIDPKVDCPWERKPETFRHPNLLEWAQENRPQLIHAALTLIRAWVSRGRPRGKASLGSYEEWAATIGGILEVAGVPGFLANRDRFYSRADRETEGWRGLIAAWWERYGSSAVGVKDLFVLLDEVEAPVPLGRGGDRSQRTRLGDALRGAVDRRFTIDGRVLQIADAGKRSRAALYQLIEQAPPPELGGKGSPRSPGSSPAAGEPGEPREPSPPASGESRVWDL